MSGTQLLRALVNERLAAAAEEIFGLVEETIGEYQDEVVRSKREITQLRQQLNILKSDTVSHRTEPQQVTGDHCPPQHEWNPIMVEPEDQEPLIPPVKQEAVELNIPGLEDDSYNALKTGYDQLEMTAESHHLSSDCSIVADHKVDYDEEWQSSNGPPLGLMPTCQGYDAQSSAGAPSPKCHELLGDDTENICGVCGSAFESRDILIDHLQTHTEIKFCHVCCACFSRDVDLIRHMHDMHKGQKPFKCHECGKLFLRRDYLVVHLRTHTGEKPFRCSYCGKSFAQSAYLCVHKRIHTGEKPYCCVVCGKWYSSSSALNHCMRNHRSNKSFFIAETVSENHKPFTSVHH